MGVFVESLVQVGPESVDRKRKVVHEARWPGAGPFARFYDWIVLVDGNDDLPQIWNRAFEMGMTGHDYCRYYCIQWV